MPSVIGGNQIGDIERLLLASGGIAIGIGEAGEELSFADHIILTLTAAREIGGGGDVNNRDVVGAGECDDERAGVRSTVVVGG